MKNLRLVTRRLLLELKSTKYHFYFIPLTSAEITTLLRKPITVISPAGVLALVPRPVSDVIS